MKRFILTVITLATCFLPAIGQESQADFLRRYSNLVERVGPAGLGVETLLGKWEAAYPEDAQMMLARFSFYFTRCRSSRVEELPQDRYLGNAPLLPITDSLGVKHNYFEIIDYDDDLFAEALRSIDQALRIKPWRLDYRMVKIDALIAYEKESPEMALSELKSLADKHFKEHPAWEIDGMESVSDEQFKAFMQDYCASLFRLGTESSAQAFKGLSEYLLTYCKDEPMYLDNLGSYYLVRKEFKKAQKYFDQVLRKHPDDMTALRNAILMARAQKDKKMEKKYLEQMARHGESENDRAGAKAQLDALNRK